MICIDVDGVLCDLFGGLGLCPSRYDEHTIDWHKLPIDFWMGLQLLPEAKKIVSLCSSVDHVILVTLPAESEDSLIGKRRWLRKHFPDIPHMLGDARYIYSGKNRTLIDDFEHNIDMFDRFGGNGVLLPRPWNKHRDRDLWQTLSIGLEKHKSCV